MSPSFCWAPAFRKDRMGDMLSSNAKSGGEVHGVGRLHLTGAQQTSDAQSSLSREADTAAEQSFFPGLCCGESRGSKVCCTTSLRFSQSKLDTMKRVGDPYVINKRIQEVFLDLAEKTETDLDSALMSVNATSLERFMVQHTRDHNKIADASAKVILAEAKLKMVLYITHIYKWICTHRYIYVDRYLYALVRMHDS